MTRKINSIGIVKESRPDESRAPIAPNQIPLIIEKYPDINIIVQPCENRTFKDNEYSKFVFKNSSSDTCFILVYFNNS